MNLSAISDRVIKVITIRDYYPIVYRRTETGWSGYAVETFRAVAKMLNRTLQIDRFGDYGNMHILNKKQYFQKIIHNKKQYFQF